MVINAPNVNRTSTRTTKVSSVVTAVHNEPEPDKTLYNVVALDDNNREIASISADDASGRLREDTCSVLALPGGPYQVRLAHEVLPSSRTGPAPEIDMATPTPASTAVADGDAPTQPADDSASNGQSKSKSKSKPRQPRQKKDKKGVNEAMPGPADGPSEGAATANAGSADNVAAQKRKLAESEGEGGRGDGDGASARDGSKKFKLENAADGSTIYNIHNNQNVHVYTVGSRSLVEVGKSGTPGPGDATTTTVPRASAVNRVREQQATSVDQADLRALWALLGANSAAAHHVQYRNNGLPLPLPLPYASYLPSPLDHQRAALAARQGHHHPPQGTSATSTGGGAGGYTYPLQLPTANSQPQTILLPPTPVASSSNANTNTMQTRPAYAGRGFAGDQRWATNGGSGDQRSPSDGVFFRGTSSF